MNIRRKIAASRGHIADEIAGGNIQEFDRLLKLPPAHGGIRHHCFVVIISVLVEDFLIGIKHRNSLYGIPARPARRYPVFYRAAARLRGRILITTGLNQLSYEDFLLL